MWDFYGFLAGKIILSKVYKQQPNGLEETSGIKIFDAVNKLFDGTSKGKEKLIGVFIMNENKLKEMVKSNDDFKSKLGVKNELNSDLKQDIKILKSRLEEYENLFFQWLDASSDESVPLVNLIRTGKIRNKVVENLFTTMFTEDPLLGYDEFEHFRGKKKVTSPAKEKVIKFKSKNNLIDDLEL